MEAHTFIGEAPQPRGYAIMPSTVRTKSGALLTAIRLGKPEINNQIWRSEDLGKSWVRLNDVTCGGDGNPPASVLLPGGHLCVTCAHRREDFGIRASISADEGKTRTPEIFRGDDGTDGDLGTLARWCVTSALC